MIVFYLTIFFICLSILVWSSDKMVEAAISISNHYRISPLLIGTVVVGFGTSSPELAVSTLAAWENQISIAVGNAFGSNITNLLLVLGITALAMSIEVPKNVLKYILPLVFIATALPGILMFDLRLNRIDGFILIAALIIILRIVMVKTGTQTETANTKPEKNIRLTILWLVIGLILLLIASEFTIWSAIAIADLLGINKLIIGLTIVAIGTSLPEIVTAVVSVYRKQHSLVIGNILGSNIFNSLAVLGAAALTGPAQVPAIAVHRDFFIMIAATLLIWGLLGRRAQMKRGAGLIALSCFIIYTTYLYLYAS